MNNLPKFKNNNVKLTFWYKSVVQKKQKNSTLLTLTNFCFSFKTVVFHLFVPHWVHLIALPLNYLRSLPAVPIVQANVLHEI